MHKEGRVPYSTPPPPPPPPTPPPRPPQHTHIHTPPPPKHTHGRSGIARRYESSALGGGLEMGGMAVRKPDSFFPLWVISASHSCQFSFSHFWFFFFSESNFEEETKTPEVKVVEISLMANGTHVYTMFYPYPLPSTLPEVCTDHSELPGGVGMQLVG